MKKFIIVLIFAFILSFGATQAKAVSLDDLLAEIMSLKTQVTELKTQLTAAVRSADALRTTQISIYEHEGAFCQRWNSGAVGTGTPVIVDNSFCEQTASRSMPSWMVPYVVSGSGPFAGKYIYDCTDGEFNWTLDMGDNHDRLGDHYSGNGVTCNLIVALANNLNAGRTPTTSLVTSVSTTKATTMPSWMAPYVVSGSGPFAGKYVYICSDNIGSKWVLDMGDDFRLGNHYDNNGIVCNLQLAPTNTQNATRTLTTGATTSVSTTKATTSTNTQVTKAGDSTPIQSKIVGSNGPGNPEGWWVPTPGSTYECDKFFKACFEWTSGHVGSGTPNLVPPSHNYLCPNCALMASRLPVVVGFLGDSSSLITYGERSDRVKEFQKFLIGQGYLAPGSDTGFYGNATMVATKTFQNAYGVPGNGTVVGPKTQIVLKKMAQ